MVDHILVFHLSFQRRLFSTHEIARQVSKSTGKDFNTSEKDLNYLLNNNKFQIDDHYWRYHINMVSGLMGEQNLIKRGDKIYIQVGFTTCENYFLILTASIIVGDRSLIYGDVRLPVGQPITVVSNEETESLEEEFYAAQNLLEDSVRGIQEELTKFLHKYNTYRSHFSLENLTPMQYIQRTRS